MTSVPGVPGAGGSAPPQQRVLDGFSWLFEPPGGLLGRGASTAPDLPVGQSAVAGPSLTSTALHRATRPLQSRGGSAALVASRVLPGKLVRELRRLRVAPQAQSSAVNPAGGLAPRRRGFGVLDIADISVLDLNRIV